MTMKLQHASAESWLRWPPEIPQNYALANPSASVFTPRVYLDGLMDPMQIQYLQPFPPGGFYSLSMPVCEPPMSLASIESPAQHTTSQTSPRHYNTTKSDKLKARNPDRSSKAKTRRHAKLYGKHKTPRDSTSPSKALVVAKDSDNPKTIKANQAQDPSQRIEFDTEIDQLMRVIRPEDAHVNNTFKETQFMLTPAASPKQESTSPSSIRTTTPLEQDLRPQKKYRCTGPNCDQVFSQKGHLTIHIRTHTGEKPYNCEYEGCDQRFSQLGNMKTHMRRHVGEKPFKCAYCDKTFVQRSITRTHEKTHNPSKPFPCILEGCTKTFSSRGNMKQHQNQYHQELLKNLTEMFKESAQNGWVLDEYRELFEYFKVHYKNSNKGVKGRGKARIVARRQIWNSEKPSETGKQAQKPLDVESPVWEPQSPGDLEIFTHSSPLSVGSQIFSEQEFGSPMSIDTPYYSL